MPISLLSRLADVPIAVVDVETTGASAAWGDRVIELGVVRLEGGRRVAEYQQLLDPGRRISPGITALTGITPAMCDGQPRFADVADTLTALLQGAAVMGHNVRFDLSFIGAEYRRAGRDMAAELGRPPVLDTVRLARRRFGRGGNGLQRLARRLDLPPATAHRALADAQTTHLVFEHLIGFVGGWGATLVDTIAAQGGPLPLVPVAAATAVAQSPLPFELEEALELRRPVLMIYLDARQKQTRRVIEPIEVRRSAAGDATLVAHCHLRADRRTFKLDRIVELKRIEDQEMPPDAEPCPPDDDGSQV